MLRPSCRSGSSLVACSFWGRKNVFTQPGSSTDLTAPKFDFRFTPESGLKSDIGPRPVRATSGLMHRSKIPIISSARFVFRPNLPTQQFCRTELRPSRHGGGGKSQEQPGAALSCLGTAASHQTKLFGDLQMDH